jgi:hypothetical protein
MHKQSPSFCGISQATDRFFQMELAAFVELPANFSNTANGGVSKKRASDWRNHSFEIPFISRDARVMQAAIQLSIFLNH